VTATGSKFRSSFGLCFVGKGRVCGVVIREEKSQRMNAAYLFICKGVVYRRIFLIVVGSKEFKVVSRVEEGVAK
jgi:hypothetical protein